MGKINKIKTNKKMSSDNKSFKVISSEEELPNEVKPLCACCTCDDCTCDPCNCCKCDPCNCPPKAVKKVGCCGDKKTEAPKKGGCCGDKKTEAPKKSGCCGDKKIVQSQDIPEITITVGGKKITIKIEDLN